MNIKDIQPKYVRARRLLVKLIAETGVKQGEAIPSVNRLAEILGVGRISAQRAVKELEREGFLTNITGSGCFLKKDISDLASRIEDEDDEAASKLHDMSYFLSPRKKDRRLTLYITDSYDRSLAVWKEALESFGRCNPDIALDTLTCHDGHIMDILKDKHVDVLHTSLAVMESVGVGRFLKMPALEDLGIGVESLFPPLRHIVESERISRCFAPFSLTLEYLYVNTGLMSRIPGGRIPVSMEEMYAMAEKFERRVAKDDEYGLMHTHLMSLLQLWGALRPDGHGSWSLDAKRAGAALRLLEKTPIKCVNAPEAYQRLRPSSDRLFADGKVLFHLRSSFFTQLLLSRCITGWLAAPPPCSPGGMVDATPSVLAVSDDTCSVDASLRLVRHLCSREIQKSFAGLGGVLPVYSDLTAGIQQDPKRPETPNDVIGRTLKISLERPSDPAATDRIFDDVNACGHRFLLHEINADEALKQLLLIVR